MTETANFFNEPPELLTSNKKSLDKRPHWQVLLLYGFE